MLLPFLWTAGEPKDFGKEELCKLSDSVGLIETPRLLVVMRSSQHGGDGTIQTEIIRV